jgi:hypothetical protein
MKKFINLILSRLIKLVNKLSLEDQMTIASLTYNESGSYLVYYLNNEKLESHKQALKGIYITLMNNERFLEFGFNKVIIVTAITYEEEFSFHHNVLITNTTTFEEYYTTVKDIIMTNYEDGDPIDVVPMFKVMVWNMDEFKNKKIKITRNATNTSNGFQTTPPKETGKKSSSFKQTPMNSVSSKRLFSSYIKPIKASKINSTVKNFATMDIETINLNNNQVPIAISIAYLNAQQVIKTKVFLIDNNLFKSQPNDSIDLLWKEYFDFISENNKLFKTIFVHNLG